MERFLGVVLMDLDILAAATLGGLKFWNERDLLAYKVQSKRVSCCLAVSLACLDQY